MRNNLEELRNKLFETLQNLTDPESGEVTEIQIEASKQVSVISRLILDTGKAEMVYNRAVREGNNTKLAFFENKPNEPQKLIH